MKTPMLSRRLGPALFCLTTIGTVLAASPETEWTVLSASGGVEFTRGQAADLSWETLLRGDRLPAAAVVRTDADGRATLSLGRSLILVDPDSTLEVPGRASSLRPLRVHQKGGSATYDIHKSRGQRFQVITPYLVAGVKGTVFRVQVGETSSSVLVTEGVVEVFTLRDDLGVDVHAGQQVHMDTLPGATPRLSPAPSEDLEILNLISRAGRRQHEEASRDGTLPRTEPGWVVVNGFLENDDESGDATLTTERLSEQGSLLDDDAGKDLTRELDKEYREEEEKRIKQLLEPIQETPAGEPQAGGTGR
jgi:hypothetical protein